MTQIDQVKEAAARDPERAYLAVGYSGELTSDGLSRLKGLCPFHSEKTPSFKIDTAGESAGRWRCYGACNRGGSIIDFYMALYRVDDPQRTARELSQLLGLADYSGQTRTPSSRTPKPGAHEPIPPDTVERLHQELLNSPERVSFLMREKGLGREIIERARLGWDSKRGRYSVPILGDDKHAGYSDIRLYRPDAPEGIQKMLAWETGRGATKLYPWPWVCDECELVLTEGEVDALNLVARGIAAFTATNGSGKWPADPPDLAGKTVWVCGDADEAGRKHNTAMPAKLYAAGAEEVRVIEWPENSPDKFDVSDYFLGGGTPEEFRAMMDAAPVVPKDDFFPDPTVYLDDRRFVAKRLADQLRGELHLGRVGGELYVYQNGVYLPNGEEILRRRAQVLLGEEHSRRRADEVVYDIQTAACVLTDEANDDISLINVANGLVDWQTGELKPHTPDFMSTIQLPVIFDPGASGSGALDRYLQTTLVDGDGHPDCIALVEEFIGYCLIPTTRFEVAFCAVGGGCNGKSTFLHLVEALLGSSNVSNIPLQEIARHRFKRAELYGKLVNMFADLDHRALRSTDYFKTIVSGDPIDAERKYGRPFSFRPCARLLFSANRIPPADDPSFAYRRRWIILPFPNRFEGGLRDRDLLAKLTTPEELSYLLNHALAKLRRLSERGEFTIPPPAVAALRAYQLASDTVTAFVSDECLLHPDARVGKQALFDVYCEWCQRSRVNPLGQADFNARLQTDHNVRERLLRLDGQVRTRSWEGIGLASDPEVVASQLPAGG